MTYGFYFWKSILDSYVLELDYIFYRIEDIYRCLFLVHIWKTYKVNLEMLSKHIAIAIWDLELFVRSILVDLAVLILNLLGFEWGKSAFKNIN